MSLQIHNREIKKYKISELIELNIEKPNIQRIINKKNVSSIIKYQLNEIRTKHKSNFLGVINIHYCEENHKYYLIDGQHRFQALNELYNQYSHNIEIFVEIVNVNKREELIKNYEIVNKNTKVAHFSDNIDKSIPEKASEHFQNKYPNIWALSTNNNRRPRRPNIRLNDFQETLGYITEKLNIMDSTKLIEIVEDENNVMKGRPKENYENVSDSMYEKAYINKFYLGFSKFSSNDEWGYKWGKDIVERHTGKQIKKIRIKTKQKIPKSIKDGSWERYIGNDIGQIKCPVCNLNDIRQNNFEAGHIISEKDNGECTIDNIIPICSKCNRSVGVQNMDNFVLKYYPENVKLYMSRNYKPIKKSKFKKFKFKN